MRDERVTGMNADGGVEVQTDGERVGVVFVVLSQLAEQDIHDERVGVRQTKLIEHARKAPVIFVRSKLLLTLEIKLDDEPSRL